MTKEEAERLAREWVLDHEQTPYNEDISSLAALLLKVAGEATHLLRESARNHLAMGHSVHCFSTRHAGHEPYRCDCGYEQAREALRAASSGEKGGNDE